MKICVFGAASAHIDEIYIKKVEELGRLMAERGHSLVFGAGGTGLMGAAARGVKEHGGYVHGVIPHFFREENVELIYGQCDEITYTENMAERKRTMEDEAEAFIIVPGGVGTFEEFFEVLTLKQLARHAKPIAIFNIDGYYNDMESFMQTAASRKFITFDTTALYKYFGTAEEVLSYIENYVPEKTSLRKMKTGD